MNNWTVEPKEAGMRLLSFVKNKLSAKTTDIRFSIEHHRCRVNGDVERFASRRLAARDKITFHLAQKPSTTPLFARPLFEDEWLIAYDKPANVSMEPGTLSPLLLVHRLDRDTTGVVLFAKTTEAEIALEGLFRKREMQKSYLAIVQGVPSQSRGSIKNHLGEISRREGELTMGIVAPSRGRLALTEWNVVTATSRTALLRLFPKTGRTHQLRVHLASLNHPILGDVRYGSRRDPSSLPLFRPMLHAEQLCFIHPFTHAPITLSAPLPADFKEILSICALSVSL